MQPLQFKRLLPRNWRVIDQNEHNTVEFEHEMVREWSTLPTPNPAGRFLIHSSMSVMWSGTLSSPKSSSSSRKKSIFSRLPLPAITANCRSLEIHKEGEEVEREQGREQAEEKEAPAVTEECTPSGAGRGRRKDKDESAIANACTQLSPPRMRDKLNGDDGRDPITEKDLEKSLRDRNLEILPRNTNCSTRISERKNFFGAGGDTAKLRLTQDGAPSRSLIQLLFKGIWEHWGTFGEHLGNISSTIIYVPYLCITHRIWIQILYSRCARADCRIFMRNWPAGDCGISNLHLIQEELFARKNWVEEWSLGFKV